MNHLTLAFSSFRRMSSSYFVNIYLYYRDVILLIEIESLLTNHRLSSLTNDRSCST